MYSKEEIISEIRRLATKLNKNSLTKNEFSRNSKISVSTVRYHFGSWNESIKTAGLTPAIAKKELIPEEDLLKDLICLYIDFGKEPTASLINAKGKYSERPYRARWKNIHEAFLVAQKKYPPETTSSSPKKISSGSDFIAKISILPETIKPEKQNRKRIVFGEPINFRGLRFAPINEQGVVYLFGMISLELGFLIESVRTEYPDCEGKRCFDKEKNQWEHIQIEFEYKSSNFYSHGHDPSNCDLIVCWEHDWKECPLEVLELKSSIKYLDKATSFL